MSTPPSECCPTTNGPFSAQRKFDLVDGKYVPTPCCAKNIAGEHAGPFAAKPRKFDQIDAATDGYGWPTGDWVPWGVTEKVIDALLSEETVWTLGDPFQTPPCTEYPAAGPLGLVYLAGPMRGIESFNFPTFHKAAATLREAGWGVFDPAQVDESKGYDFTGMTGNEDTATLGFDLREALADDLDFIARRADAVAVLPGWEHSKGARAEVATARALGIPVFDAVEGPSRPIVDNEALFKHLEARGEPDRFFIPKDTPMVDIARSMLRERDIELPGMWESADLTGGSTDGEVRITNESGASKGSKPERHDLIPTRPLAALATHYGVGSAKYEPVTKDGRTMDNWRFGYPVSLSYAAMQRHARAFWGGEDIDPETGSWHITAVAWHAFTIYHLLTEPGYAEKFDDRQERTA